MKIRVSLWLTVTLFVMMVGAGIASGCLGYYMGREALKAVTQPDINSNESTAKRKPLGGEHKGLKIVNEKEILVKVYNLIHAQENNQSWNKKSPEAQSQTNLVNYQSPKEINSPLFPVSHQSAGVTLKVERAEFEGGSLLLSLNLKNEGKQSVGFLYSFLDVRDEHNRPLSAIADGLPENLLPDGQNYSGVLRIPKVLLHNTQHISLTMTNYPDQTLELKIPRIPISN